MGFGDAERGMSMQMVQNSIWNLYLDAVKMSIFPPIMVNKDNIASMSSIQYGASKKWLVRNQIGNAIAPVNLSPQGIATFNNTFQAANASLLNVFGTSDTTLSVNQDNSFGKTPQALKMQSQRESTRDNSDRYYMEQFVTDVMKKFVNLLGKKQSSNIELRMFPEEVEKIKREVSQIETMYNEKTGKLSIPKGKKNVIYDYEFVSGSTFAQDKVAQQENLSQLMSLYQASQTPQGNTLVNDLDRSGYKFNFGELFKRFVVGSGIPEWDKILEEKTEEEIGEQTLNNDRGAFEQMVQQMQGGQPMPGVPTMPQQPQQPQVPQMGGNL
jgi:hypothetical protein